MNADHRSCDWYGFHVCTPRKISRLSRLIHAALGLVAL